MARPQDKESEPLRIAILAAVIETERFHRIRGATVAEICERVGALYTGESRSFRHKVSHELGTLSARGWIVRCEHDAPSPRLSHMSTSLGRVQVIARDVE